jgi:hypothetical protein
LLDLCGLKIIKIIFGVIGILWALALIPQLVDAAFHTERPHAFGTAAGSILGMLLASTISFVFFRKAFVPAIATGNRDVEVSKLSRRYNVVVPLIALMGLAFETSSMYKPVSWAKLCVTLGMSDVKVVQLFVIFIWVGMIGFGFVALLHATILIARPLRRRIHHGGFRTSRSFSASPTFVGLYPSPNQRAFSAITDSSVVDKKRIPGRQRSVL